MIVLDTHAWIWWAAESDALPSRLRKQISAESEIGISVLSCWEVAMLVAKGRLAFNTDVGDWIHSALGLPRVRMLELTPAVAVLSTRLPGTFHGDPVDRMIVATALAHRAPVATKDKRITSWGYVRVLW